MSIKRPLCNYSGELHELHTADSSYVKDGSILNQHIGAAAAIDLSKLALISSISEKSSLTYNDLFPISDSEDVNLIKKVSWDNLVANNLVYRGNYDVTMVFGGNDVGLAYTTHTGNYITICDAILFYQISIVLSAKGSSTGAAALSLPVTAADTNLVCPGIFNSILGVTFDPPIIGSVGASSNWMYLFDNNSGARRALTDADFVNTSSFRISGFYFI